MAFVGFGEVDSGETGVDVTANGDEFGGRLRFGTGKGGWEKISEVGDATGCAGSDTEGEALGEPIVGGWSEDDDVAGIGSGRGSGEHDAGGALEGEVLVGVDGEVDFAFEQSGIEFGDEEFASWRGGEQDVEQLIALGFDANEFDAETWVEAFDLTGDPGALSEGEEGASGAEAERGDRGWRLSHGAMGNRRWGRGLSGSRCQGMDVRGLGAVVRLCVFQSFPFGERGQIFPAMRNAEGRSEGSESGTFVARALGASQVGHSRASLLVVEAEDVVERVETRQCVPSPAGFIGAAEVDHDGSAGLGARVPELTDAFGIGMGIVRDADHDGVGGLPGIRGVRGVDDIDRMPCMAVAAEGLGELGCASGVAIQDLDAEACEPGGDGAGQFAGTDEEERRCLFARCQRVEEFADKSSVGGATDIGEVLGADLLGVFEEALEPGKSGAVGSPCLFDLAENVGFALEPAFEACRDAEEKVVGLLTAEVIYGRGEFEGLGGLEDAEPALAGVEDEGGACPLGKPRKSRRLAGVFAMMKDMEPVQHGIRLSQARALVS